MTEYENELDLKIAGQEVRTKGYRLVDLIWLPLVLGVCYIGLALSQHEAAAQSDKAILANTLRESNTQIAQALKESNARTADAIDRMAIEQKRATNAMREVACLSDPLMRNRSDAREFCKRMSRDDR